MIDIDRVVVVEGKYDKIKLESIVSSPILTTGGFEIFKNKEQQALLRQLANKRGLVVLTDSDVAGFKIRSFLRSICGKENIIDVYIPDLYGKEKRKRQPSKEGKLGVEGVSPKVLTDALTAAGALCAEAVPKGRQITKADLYRDGLSGGQDSSTKRALLKSKLGLPENLSANSLLTVLNVLFTYEQYTAAVRESSDGE